jgi:hypothetical protein
VDKDANQDLLQLFQPSNPTKRAIEVWQSLVHVCRRWRSVVFGSPHRLNLHLVCTSKTPARKTLDVWPALPVLIKDSNCLTQRADNLVAVLEHKGRVDKIELFDVNSSPLKKVLAAMQEPFPQLTHLLLESHDETVPVLPNLFLGGSAPCLQSLWLDRIPFPGLPKLLLSATYLVHLNLLNIPHSGYISPEAMVTALSTLTRLGLLSLGFQSPQSFPDQESRRPPSLTRTFLPALTSLKFKGASEYLDVLVAHVDTPGLNHLDITFFNQILFDTPQFIQFVSRTPKLKAPERALILFDVGGAMVNLLSRTSGYGYSNLRISCRELDWQVSSLEQVCSSCLPPFSTLEDLYIYEAPYLQPDRRDTLDNTLYNIRNTQDNIENTLWLELLHPFTAVKNLYLSEEFARHIAPALQELVGRNTTEVLPILQNMFLEGLQPSGPVQESIRKLVTARQVTALPITVTRWERVRGGPGG